MYVGNDYNGPAFGGGEVCMLLDSASPSQLAPLEIPPAYRRCALRAHACRMEARGTPGSRAVAIANRHAATAVRAHSGGAPMTEASCMTLAYAKSRVEASKAAGEYVGIPHREG